MTAIEASGLKYVYGVGTPYEMTALDNFDIEIDSGDFVGIIGHTGSGKSTLMQLIDGLTKPAGGTLKIFGEDMFADAKTTARLRKKVGLVFQYPEYQLFEETVEKDIAFGPKNLGLSEDEVYKRVRYAAQITGLPEEYLQKSPFELSGGEKRRTAIAGVIAMRPEIFILDEPTAGLDPKGRDEILARVREYREDTGATVLLVSHSMEDVTKNASKVLVLSHGKKMMYGKVGEVFERSKELLNAGLDLPQITKVFIELKNRGVDVPTSVYTVKQAIEVLGKLSGGGSRA